MGQIRKRGGVYWIRYYRDGRRFEESARSDKKQTAVDLLKIREGDVAKGVPISAKIGRLRFEEAAKDLLTDYQVNGKRSHDNLKHTIVDGALEPWFRGRRMATLTTADIRAYVADRQEKGYANGTINRELSALKRMFTLAIQAGKLLQRPHIPMLAEHNVRKGFFEREQFEAVRNRLAPMYQGVVTLAYYTGWRINSEILTLEWRQIDRDAGVDSPRAGHDEEPRGSRVPLRRAAEVAAAIDGLWARHEALAAAGIADAAGLLPARGAGRVTFWKRWKTACDGRRVSGADPARLPPHRGTEPEPGRRTGNDRDEYHRTQDPERVRPLRHHERRRPRGGVAEAARDDDGDNCGDKRHARR